MRKLPMRPLILLVLLISITTESGLAFQRPPHQIPHVSDRPQHVCRPSSKAGGAISTAPTILRSARSHSECLKLRCRSALLSRVSGHSGKESALGGPSEEEAHRWAEFEAWLRGHGVDTSLLEVSQSPTGLRGLAARRDILQGRPDQPAAPFFFHFSGQPRIVEVHLETSSPRPLADAADTRIARVQNRL